MRKATPKKPFQWTGQAQIAAAVLGTALSLGEAKQEAADAAQVSVRTIERWAKVDEFAQLVDTIRSENARRIIDSAKDTSLARFENRMAVCDEVEASIRTIVRERGEQASPGVPGGRTGLMRTIVTERFGTDTHTVETEHVVDKQLIDARNANTALAHKMASDLEAVKDAGEPPVTYEFVAD